MSSLVYPNSTTDPQVYTESLSLTSYSSPRALDPSEPLSSRPLQLEGPAHLLFFSMPSPPTLLSSAIE